MTENKKFKNEAITPRSKNFTKWYDDVLAAANLIHYGKVKGTIIFNYNSTFIWEKIKEKLNESFEKFGIKNVIFPTLIPYSSFALEKEHLEGFAPEMFLITKKSINSPEMQDPLVLRPTSEISFSYFFKEILVSYNQLPFKFNQWGSVFRVEKNTRPFLRTSEFLWHELHSLHISKEDALEFTKTIHNNYIEFITKFLCIPVLTGEKTENERFAGAENTFTCEALMQDGQALQCATTHYLSKNFSIPYEITFRNKNNELENPHQTSAGVSTRIIGAIIMTHSDDLGLVLPWNIAINQIAICLLNNDKEIIDYANDLKNKLSNYRVIIDDSNKTMGYKIKDQQVIGTPITILVGKNEVEKNEITFILRNKNEKEKIAIDEFIRNINSYIENYNHDLYEKAENHLINSIEICNNLNDVKNAIENKHIALAPWGGNKEDEEKFKKENSISPRCIKENIRDENIKCFYTGKKAKYWVYFAKSY